MFQAYCLIGLKCTYCQIRNHEKYFLLPGGLVLKNSDLLNIWQQGKFHSQIRCIYHVRYFMYLIKWQLQHQLVAMFDR